MAFWNGSMAFLEQIPFWALLLTLFLFAAVQQVFPPCPAELVLFAAGCLARPALPMLAAYGLGAVLTATGLFWLAQKNGAALCALPAVQRLFPRVWQRRARVLLRHYGAPGLILCKFIPGAGTVSLLVAGAMGLRGASATLAAGFGSLGPCFLYFYGGRLASGSLPVLLRISHSYVWAAVLLAAGLLGLCTLFVSRRILVKKAK